VEAAPDLLERPPTGPLSVAYFVVGFSLGRLGRLDEALALITPPPDREAIPATDESWGAWAVFVARAQALIYAGRLSEAEELLASAYAQLVDQPAAEARAHVANRLAVLHLEQGRVQSAFRRANEAYTLFLQLGRTYPALYSYRVGAQALAMGGAASKAAETLAAHEALGLPQVLLHETDLLQARAWTQSAAGNLPAARDQLEAAAELGEEVGDLIGAACALHGLARLGRARQVAARLAALADGTDGDLVAARAAYANAVAARNVTSLIKVADEFEDMGTLLYAAEARAEAAVMLRRVGKPREAAAEEQGAARLLARCEGAATPPIQSIRARVRLTPGELDAAVHAAAGRTNKQIATDMHLSVRTVETYLQHTYDKLGVSGRRDLAEALGDQPKP
jgi:ATP/maltotriose-dependent transcriptional regulator MalT